MKVALYARVSTRMQDETLQLPALRNYAGLRGWEVVAEFQDEASAKDANRPGWQALRSDARARRFDAVLVTKLDRIMRSVGLLVSELEAFEKWGVQVITLNTGVLDMSSAAGKLSIQILGSVAEWEREAIGERTREALAAKKEQGVKLGRPAKQIPIHKIALLRKEGKTWKEISKITGVPLSTIRTRQTKITQELEQLGSSRK